MGEVFAGRYELVDPIGRGGVGAVWRAWDHRRRRYVAAKVLQQRDAHSLLRFVREQALRIDHPHVLAPTSWAADDDKVLFTMNLVAGGSLVHLVGDYGPLPPSFVCTLLDQLLAGLAAVHAEGVVHRDVKPANVLLEATGTGRPRLRLSDFGIAMRLGEPRLTETNLVVGTPGYLAPEQMMGAEPDFPADLFAAGLVALYLLEGAKPDTKALVQYFAEHGTPGAPKGVPEPLWQVVASLLQPDPQARFSTATGARKALAAAAELLPEPGPDDELIEIFDQLGPLPPGFGPDGPLKRAPGVEGGPGVARRFDEGSGSTNSGSVPADGGFRANGDGSAPAHGGAASTGTGSVASGSFGTGGVPSDPRQGGRPSSTADVSESSRPAPSAAQEPSVPSQPLSMSDTGSFHLPPPQATGSTLRPPSAYVSPHDPTHVLSSPQPHIPQYPAQPPTPPTPAHPPTPSAPQRVDASTASYTAQSPQVPPSAHPIQQPSRQHRAGRRAARGPAHGAARRPGPPARVAIPVLLLALACYAVGFWALARI